MTTLYIDNRKIIFKDILTSSCLLKYSYINETYNITYNPHDYIGYKLFGNNNDYYLISPNNKVFSTKNYTYYGLIKSYSKIMDTKIYRPTGKHCAPTCDTVLIDSDKNLNAGELGEDVICCSGCVNEDGGPVQHVPCNTIDQNSPDYYYPYIILNNLSNPGGEGDNPTNLSTNTPAINQCETYCKEHDRCIGFNITIANGSNHNGTNQIIDYAYGYNGCTLWGNNNDSDITYNTITNNSEKNTCCLDLTEYSSEASTNYQPFQSWIQDSSPEPPTPQPPTPQPPTPQDASNSNYISFPNNCWYKHGATCLNTDLTPAEDDCDESMEWSLSKCIEHCNTSNKCQGFVYGTKDINDSSRCSFRENINIKYCDKGNAYHFNYYTYIKPSHLLS